MSEKKVVHYRGIPQIVGDRALIYPVDHPDTVNVTNTEQAITSPIVRKDLDTGEFETLNTIYRPLVLTN